MIYQKQYTGTHNLGKKKKNHTNSQGKDTNAAQASGTKSKLSAQNLFSKAHLGDREQVQQ